MTQPSEFLPRDRDGALLMIKAKLYARLAEVNTLIDEGYDDDSEYAEGYDDRLISERMWLRDVLEIIERS